MSVDTLHAPAPPQMQPDAPSQLPGGGAALHTVMGRASPAPARVSEANGKQTAQPAPATTTEASPARNDAGDLRTGTSGTQNGASSSSSASRKSPPNVRRDLHGRSPATDVLRDINECVGRLISIRTLPCPNQADSRFRDFFASDQSSTSSVTRRPDAAQNTTSSPASQPKPHQSSSATHQSANASQKPPGPGQNNEAEMTRAQSPGTAHLQPPANGVKANNRRQSAAQADSSSAIPEHLIRDVSYVPKRRGRPPAAPSNGYERVLSPVASQHMTMAADPNMEAMRMALEAVARESARAGALQAQLDRALQDVQHLRQKEQAMLAEFDHRVLRAVKHHKQQLEAALAAQQTRIEELEDRLREGGIQIKSQDADASTMVPDCDSQRTTSLSPLADIDAMKTRLPPMAPPVQTRLPPPPRSISNSPEPMSASVPPSEGTSSHKPSRRAPSLGRFETGPPLAPPQGRSTSGSGTKLPSLDHQHQHHPHVTSEKRTAADSIDHLRDRDDASSVASSERSAKRRRTSQETSHSHPHAHTYAQQLAQRPETDGFFDAARMRAYATAGAPIPEYDVQRIKLIYEEDSKGNHVCRVCTLNSASGQSVGFPVGTPEVDLVMHGVGAHPGLWHSSLSSDSLNIQQVRPAT
ncbi:hypothetical protein EXIGLDRAFT_779013 [Exidia glandulosa HHB12029]|uniref:Uncharacterized protein n=1 Tax=Exidia glandulosa HHB12029 TaxID=1314781 RepID=A0A165C9G7_EXIGL|nr:hypothetical protein EXIGLDRAFT_779013 [Exidia glandulosa HHB12029]